MTLDLLADTGAVEPDSPALLRAAAQAGSEISDRMLETFRAQGLIPRPRRVGYRGRVPQWRYSPGTDKQLVALLRWREHTKDPDLLKVLLWVDGFMIPATSVRDAIVRELRSITEAIDNEISLQIGRLGLDRADENALGQAIDALARTMAAKRGATTVPRRSRVRSSDRAHAIALMIRLFGVGEAIEGTAAEAETVERVLGMAPNGRRQAIADSGPWLTGPAEDMFSAADIAGLPRLLDVASDASDTELAAARQSIIALFRHLPLMARMIGALFGDDNYAGLVGASQIDQHPESIVYIVPLVVSMLRAGWTESLDLVTSALRAAPKLAERAQGILDMPAATITANLADQPNEVRERVQRIIDGAVEGKFDS